MIWLVYGFLLAAGWWLFNDLRQRLFPAKPLVCIEGHTIGNEPYTFNKYGEPVCLDCKQRVRAEAEKLLAELGPTCPACVRLLREKEAAHVAYTPDDVICPACKERMRAEIDKAFADTKRIAENDEYFKTQKLKKVPDEEKPKGAS